MDNVIRFPAAESAVPSAVPQDVRKEMARSLLKILGRVHVGDIQSFAVVLVHSDGSHGVVHWAEEDGAELMWAMENALAFYHGEPPDEEA